MDGYVMLAGAAAVVMIAAVAGALAMYWRTSNIMRSMDRMIDMALSGNFREKDFSEGRFSRLEAKTRQYLAKGNSVQRQAERDRENLKTTISNLSHQTKTPIANILLYIQLLAEKENLNGEAGQLLSQIEGQAEKLNFLIASLVKMSRLESGIISLMPAKNHVAELAYSLYEAFLPRAGREGKSLTLDLHGESPAFGERGGFCTEKYCVQIETDGSCTEKPCALHETDGSCTGWRYVQIENVQAEEEGNESERNRSGRIEKERAEEARNENGSLETAAAAKPFTPAGSGAVKTEEAAEPFAPDRNDSIETAEVFDSRWTMEAMENIMDNALKYTPEGGHIRISVMHYKMFARIDIIDDGMGIREEESAKIFGRFYRSQEAAQSEGVGIGLYLAREIISRENGYIRVRSSHGKGSTFSVFLPKADELFRDEGAGTE